MGSFLIDRYGTPSRFDGNALGGAIMLYVREDVPSKHITAENYIEAFFTEKKLPLCNFVIQKRVTLIHK